MHYYSSRNSEIKTTPSKAILSGIAPDGGLFLPEKFPAGEINIEDIIRMNNYEIAEKVLSAFFTDFTADEIKNIVKDSYSGTFENDDMAPLTKVGDKFVLELYHGPTCAFKDVALSVLPRLITTSKKKNGIDTETVILTATSGDTGSAAAHGFSDVENTKIIVFYPEHGTSAVQEKQMTSCPGKNVFVASVNGNFDDAQTGVKNIFSSLKLPETKTLSSANSINIGRLVPQITYYFTSYRDLVNRKEINPGDKVDFIVPTGNFGDILAGYFAYMTGLPVGRLVCASNENNVLTEFFDTGVYRAKRDFHITRSPSMDILVSSNLERLISLILGTEKARVYMEKLKTDGEYAVTEDELIKLRDKFSAACADDSEALEAICEVFEKYGYLMDTHTAVAWSAAEKTKNESSNKTVILSTASPYKFPESVLKALGVNSENKNEFELIEELHALTKAPVPVPLKNLDKNKILHNDKIKKEDMANYVLKKAEEQI